VRDRGLKVVLSGEGSDELFWGYELFKETALRLRAIARPGGERMLRLLAVASRPADARAGDGRVARTPPRCRRAARPAVLAPAALRHRRVGQGFYSPEWRGALAHRDPLDRLAR